MKRVAFCGEFDPCAKAGQANLKGGTEVMERRSVRSGIGKQLWICRAFGKWLKEASVCTPAAPKLAIECGGSRAANFAKRRARRAVAGMGLRLRGVWKGSNLSKFHACCAPGV
jgi:hypothetical protein